MNIIGKDESSIFGDSSKATSISHSSIHKSMHDTKSHSDIHNHSKIHESMHFGSDKIKNPLSDHPGF